MSVRISVITPTYNRAAVLGRVFESLMNQTNKEFEWIIIDDGSKDDTKTVVEGYVSKANFQIKYVYQDNNGKHIAINKGVELAIGEFIAIADSDDSFIPTAFEVMLDYWDRISPGERELYRGITCRCYDPDTGEKIGRSIKDGYEDYYGIDATYKYGLDFEMWGINRTDLMRKFPFPDIRRTDNGGLSFFPEIVIWDNMGRNYKTRYIDDCLRAYYRDQENATTNKTGSRSRENVYLWEHLINDIFDYAKYKPMRFIKALVGLSMDNLLIGKKFFDIVKIGNTPIKRLLITVLFPVGWALYIKKR
ncbi:glycosyltransferase family A protein [Pseudobutyrivibrio xylanivorans]|uniref:Glycosyltransferase involved in cell wall bisynthesis n=1 Tax=Pseudobutyrivibrio xylanivorans DSM 14809 TaxID=1123012 RepID=A0A1M6I3C8_PSEXY|nr:glycosyltransferase family A protein [Pseudobutyrivibrio xylanivorans]SHJ29001.1 Glycosyltransferase involved in cell wall bisynthesis [Pseudobutyrivibrio xylanivorans DSM 14809]